MTIDLALLCDAATVDPSGKLNVLGIFDRIHSAEFPARHGRLCLVLRLETRAADEGERSALIRLLTPGGEELVRLDGRIQVGPATGDAVSRIPQVLNLDGLVFPEPGTYRFEVAVDGTRLVTLPLILSGGGGRPRPDGTPPTGPEGVPLFFAPGGPAEA
jgi:hypothetical protein